MLTPYLLPECKGSTFNIPLFDRSCLLTAVKALARRRSAAANKFYRDIPSSAHLFSARSFYDEKGLRENARRVNAAFAWNPGFREYFAVKATPNPALLKLFREEGWSCRTWHRRGCP